MCWDEAHFRQGGCALQVHSRQVRQSGGGAGKGAATCRARRAHIFDEVRAQDCSGQLC